VLRENLLPSAFRLPPSAFRLRAPRFGGLTPAEAREVSVGRVAGGERIKFDYLSVTVSNSAGNTISRSSQSSE